MSKNFRIIGGTGEGALPPPEKKDVSDAVIVIVEKYRNHFAIPSRQQLLLAEVEEIMAGVRDRIYEYEEIIPK